MIRLSGMLLLLFAGACTHNSIEQANNDVQMTEGQMIDAIYTGVDSIHEADKMNGRPIIEWVDIPAGTFIMGDSQGKDGENYELTPHKVTLKAFKMSKYEVTVEQFNEYCKAIGLRPTTTDPHWRENKSAITDINWKTANDFATWMGCRLPTEAEWEYACRAGSTTPYYTGNDLSKSQANFDHYHRFSQNPKDTITWPFRLMLVGKYPPNAWGLNDMHGNVSEWCADTYVPYDENIQSYPDIYLISRIYRGGSWDKSKESNKCAMRWLKNQNYGDSNIGFRLVKS